MNNSMKTKNGFLLMIVGILAMTLLSLTKIVPTTAIAGYSIFVGIAFFFLVEAVEKTPEDASGLQFKTFFRDITKPHVLPLVLLPVATGIATMVVGDLIFKGGFHAHLVSRTSAMLSYDKLPLLAAQVVIAALGEEIAWRGFFVGKGMEVFPFWLCALVSSLLFAAGHISIGNFGLVFYDVSTIFLDSMIYALIYKKSGNCLISTVAHILCNATGIAAVLFFL